MAIGPVHGETIANVGNPVGLSGPEQRVALVIGNSHYQNVTQLPNPANDAKAVAQLLNSAGFEVIAATDLDHNQMIQVIQDFSSRIAGHGQNTVAMIYYAGHGVQVAGENYLVPVDARISSEPDLINGSVRLVDVMATLETIPSRMRIVVLDACRNNPFPALNDAGRGLAIVDAPNGSIVGYSTAPGTEALDGNGDHSPYTQAFLREAHEKNLPIEQLFKRVRLDVNNTTDGQQTPWESSSLTSDFYFFGDTAVAATRPPMQMKPTFVASDLPSRAARQAYDYVLAENSVEDYQEFIQLYPQDPLCDRIRALLTSLVLAQAWHNAVLANSPFAYQAFYKKYSGSPYAQNALKLASQPKLIPLSQPKQIFALSSLKLGNPSIPQGGLAGASAGKLGLDKLGEGGKVVTLPPSGTNGNIGKIGTDKLGEGGKIVTLPSSGTNASHSGNTGKIVEMPVNGLNKSGESQNSKLLKDSKLKDEVIHTEDHPVKSFTPAHIDQPPVRFHQQPVITNGGNSFRTAQFHGPALQPMGRPGGGMFMRH
nr:caspase family protein [Bradyrhizobium lablabi]